MMKLNKPGAGQALDHTKWESTPVLDPHQKDVQTGKRTVGDGDQWGEDGYAGFFLQKRALRVDLFPVFHYLVGWMQQMEPYSS